MFRYNFPSRLYWLLLIPLAFSLMRGVIIWNPDSFLKYKRISIEDYEAHAHDYQFVKYVVCSLSLNARQYLLGQLLANACLVIGTIALIKTWYQRRVNASSPMS